MTAQPVIEAPHEAHPPAPDLSHEWVVAAMIRVPGNVAKAADFRGSFRLKADQRIEALDTYCQKCKRPLDEAYDTVCQAKVNNEHLIGGNQSERAKRKHYRPPSNAILLPGARINRRGTNAVLRGEI